MHAERISINPRDQEIIDSLLSNGMEKRKGEEELFNRYAYFIREAMRKYGLQEEDAFDAYADAILSALEKITNRQFEGRASLKTFLFQIFHNKCVDLLRKKSTNRYSVNKTQPVTDMLHQLTDDSKTVVQHMIDKADWETLKQKILELGQNCRDMLLLSADGYSDREIAQAMEYKTAEVVKTSRLRCMEKLRQLFTGRT